MKLTGSLGAALSALALVVATSLPAAAQTGLSQANKITTAEAAMKLLQDPEAGADLRAALEANGIDTSDVGDVEVVKWPGPIFDAEGGALRIFNCSGGGIKVKTFNSNDSVTLVAYQEKSIGNGSASELKCATKSCKVKIGNGNVYSALSGVQVLLGGKLQATNSVAVASGCGIYAKPKSNFLAIEGQDVVAIPAF